MKTHSVEAGELKKKTATVLLSSPWLRFPIFENTIIVLFFQQNTLNGLLAHFIGLRASRNTNPIVILASMRQACFDSSEISNKKSKPNVCR